MAIIRKKKFHTYPLWSLIKCRGEPKRFPVTPIVPVILAKDVRPVKEELEKAVQAQDTRAVNWLTASWMPQDPHIRRESRGIADNFFEGGMQVVKEQRA